MFGTRRKNQNTSGVRIRPGIWNSRSFQPQAMPPARTMAIRNRPIRPPISCILVYSEAIFWRVSPGGRAGDGLQLLRLDFALRLGLRDGCLRRPSSAPGLHLGQAGHDLRHLLDRAEGDAELQANPIVVTIVVRRSSGENSAAMLGRLSVPASRFCAQTGDSGRNGRMRISGIAGIRPDISVYRHGGVLMDRSRSMPSERQEARASRWPGKLVAVLRRAMPLATATSSPPTDENACV